jgi:predicted DsbA family dithiol-disulfide isomerase
VQEEVERFCELWGFGGTVLLDDTAEYARALGVRGVPTNVLVDEKGTVRAVGLVEPGQLDAAVEQLYCS